MITLSGGPLDGQTYEFINGEVAEFGKVPGAAPVLDFSVQAVEPFRFEKWLYRRSLRNPNIFVFQP